MARGLEHAVIPSQNVKDLEDIPADLRRKIDIKSVDSIDQLLPLVLTPEVDDTREKRPDFLRQGAARQTGRETAGQSRRRALILRSACPRRVSPARDARRGVFMWQL